MTPEEVLLGEHTFDGPNRACKCGYKMFAKNYSRQLVVTKTRHQKHRMDVLARYVRDREADAWDDGRESFREDMANGRAPSTNPYRDEAPND